MTRNLAKRMQQWVESRHVLWGVFVASLAETTAVPFPIEVVLIPVMLTNSNRLWLIAGSALAGSLVGASGGYLIGYAAYESVGQPFLETTRLTEQFEAYRSKLEEDGFWYVSIIALSPVPFQIAYLGAGVVKMSFLHFLAGSIVGRGIRFFGLALLVFLLGRAAGPWLERHKFKVAVWSTLIFVALFLAYKLLLS